MQGKIGGYPNSKGGTAEYLMVQSHGMTAGKGYLVGPGFITEAIPDSEMGIVCVALDDSASGDIVVVQIRGACSAWLDSTAAPTVGNSVMADNSLGLLKDGGGAATNNPGSTGDDEVGFVLEAGSGGSADSVIFLYGLPVTTVS